MDGTARFVSSHDVEVEQDGATVKLTGKQIFYQYGFIGFRSAYRWSEGKSLCLYKRDAP